MRPELIHMSIITHSERNQYSCWNLCRTHSEFIQDSLRAHPNSFRIHSKLRIPLRNCMAKIRSIFCTILNWEKVWVFLKNWHDISGVKFTKSSWNSLKFAIMWVEMQVHTYDYVHDKLLFLKNAFLIFVRFCIFFN